MILLCSQNKPFLTDDAVNMISILYSKLRKTESRGLLVTARALESLIRISTALAKLSFPQRDVSKEDVIEAYILVRHSLFGESEGEIRRTVEQYTEKKKKDKKSQSQKKTEESSKSDDLDDGEEDTRYTLFVDIVGDITENLEERQITMKDMAELVEKERSKRQKEIGEKIKKFSDKEVKDLVQKLKKRIRGITIDGDNIYF